MGLAWCPPGADRAQVGPKVAPWTQGCFTTLGELPRNFPWGCKFADDVSIMEHLQYNLFSGIIRCFRIVDEEHHLISNTNYTTKRGILFAAAKISCHENMFLKYAKCNDSTPLPDATNHFHSYDSQRKYHNKASHHPSFKVFLCTEDHLYGEHFKWSYPTRDRRAFSKITHYVTFALRVAISRADV